MHCLYLSKKRVVSDSFEYDLSSWLMKKESTATYSDADCIKVKVYNKKVTCGILTNMKQQGGSISYLQETDALGLGRIIKKVITFPFIGTSESESFNKEDN
ncbi:hypothetical protein S83_034816 [Arachis hypogaea]